ncbi:Plasmodium variant antigen protein Cir/Yir/Bir, putative [Plasmodium berghei]|uniref:Plasmodium variant antigen protein Cir/Yir/Bir, putative n=1 Tax=Plasmodium berghei TaxID=5821 RepID=A0A1C6WGA6_PLABE|nr:Plasmodium variant antigen protein Cir/Yir/Bir, putative [Plasmodium berghei]
MNDYVCRRFLLVRNWFPDQLNSEGKYYFNDDKNFKEYCNNKICNTDLEKINAGCLLLFNQFFGSSTSFKYNYVYAIKKSNNAAYFVNVIILD